MLELKNVTKIYKGKAEDTLALNGVNLTIADGEFAAVCGASGTGKSTLMNILGCVDKPTGGEYYIDGCRLDYKNRRQIETYRKEKFSFIFQNFALMDRYSIYENIEMPLIAKNMKRKERKSRIEESIQLVGLDEPLYKYPSELSGGQQQRVAIARTLAMGNPVILADEPTGALDEKNAEMLMELFLALQARGNTIIMVTHNPKMAKYADRIVQIETLQAEQMAQQE